MIKIEGISKSFGKIKVLDNIGFTINKGEVVGFLGPNGAGKTTTMRILTGYLEPNKGSVEICGVNVLNNPVEARKLMGYLPEDSPLYGEMKVAEFLEFIAEVKNVHDEKKFADTIIRCGVKDVLDKNIEELSHGYRQRVGLAQALLSDPEVLILDEPTSGLDPNQIVEIRNLIREIGREKTVILSTHILPEVEITCDRVIIINKGKIVGEGNVSEITEKGQKQLENVFRDLTLNE